MRGQNTFKSSWSININKQSNHILLWLSTVLGLICLIVMVGGITRLTGSGLSIVDWKPLMGFLPPLSETQWQQVFNKYQQFPEYMLKNNYMTLSQFKHIFFWEYLHRLLGRLIGMALIFPYLYFCIRKQISSKLKKRGIVMIVWVCLQGVLGWYMVKSGLVNDPNVSHFRLASHLLMAFFLFQYILWTVFEMRFSSQNTHTIPARLKCCVGAVIGLVVLQIIYGAFTAGLDAGWGYNTFPKMGQYWVPPEIGALIPAWKNLLYNRTAIQFIHRVLGVLVVISFVSVTIYMRKFLYNKQQMRAFKMVVLAVLIQFVLGVLTIIHAIPTVLAVAHQMGALWVLSASVFVWFSLKKNATYPSGEKV